MLTPQMLSGDGNSSTFGENEYVGKQGTAGSAESHTRATRNGHTDPQ